jgi:hypothetical protein
MATTVYESATIETIDGKEIYITPLKIKYLREFMDAYEDIKLADNDDEALTHVVNCVRICMKQYSPDIKTSYQIEDTFDIKTLYTILNIAAGISIKEESEEEVAKQAKESGASWENLDLAKIESEAFLIGIWKDYEELERSLSLPELTAMLNAKRELEYSDRRFHAAIQGIDLDEQTGKKEKNAWEAMKARVFSRGKTEDPNDISSFQGAKAAKAGFGIGMGLGYEDLTKK